MYDRYSLRYTYITSLFYQTMKPSFTEILKSNYNHQARNYLFYHNLSLPTSHIHSSIYFFFTAVRTCNWSEQKLFTKPDHYAAF